MASDKERIWLTEYLECWNATEAARRAGYAWPEKQGPAKRAKFEDEISDALTQYAMGKEEAMARLAEIARGTWSEYITPKGDVDIAKIVEDGNAHLIVEIRDTREGRVYKFCDMQGALVDILKTHGAFVERHEVTGEITTAIRVIGGVDLDAV